MQTTSASMAWLFLQENVQVQYLQKIAQMRKKSLRPHIFNDTVESNFLHEVQFSAAIGAAHFPAAFGMLLSQHPKEGAPFLGTALDEYKQSIEPAVSCHFHLLLYPYLFAK